LSDPERAPTFERFRRVEGAAQCSEDFLDARYSAWSDIGNFGMNLMAEPLAYGGGDVCVVDVPFNVESLASLSAFHSGVKTVKH